MDAFLEVLEEVIQRRKDKCYGSFMEAYNDLLSDVLYSELPSSLEAQRLVRASFPDELED